MGYTEDLAEAQKMKAAIERYGVKVSIELQAGAGGSWSIGTHRLIMSHHTASRPSQGLTPALGIVKLGRPDVPGPLANGYMGYDGVYRILTFGRANHPGAGGPVTLDGVTVPRDNGRPYIWGTEFEGGYEPYSGFMHDRMARANAGLTDYFADRTGATVEANLEHKTWAPIRKPDRIGYTRETSIERINAVRTAPTTTSEEDDMFTDEDRKRLIAIQDKSDKTFHGVDKSLLPATTAVREHVYALRTQTVPQLQGEIKGLAVALAQVAGGALDLDAVMQAAREGANDGVSEALAAIDADVTVRVQRSSVD